MFMVHDLNMFQVVFNHKQVENKKTGLILKNILKKVKQKNRTYSSMGNLPTLQQG